MIGGEGGLFCEGNLLSSLSSNRELSNVLYISIVGGMSGF